MAERQPGITKKMTFGGEEFEVPFAKGNPGKSREELDEIKRKLQEDPEAGDGEMVATMGFCAKYNPHTYMTEIPGVMCERDVACVLRDGTTIYADIYRPANTTEKVPVICVFAPFGKNPSEGMDSWQLMGVPPKTVSQYAKFEAPDPGYWCHYGYAVANVDPRGVGNSEGDVYLWGSQDAQDGYDFIEWVTAQEWCNGRATMIGNSGVCMAHWRIAATRPPHLACLAAWEGQGDLYRESYFCGGIPNPDYETHIIQALAVNNYIEDTPAMVAKYPLMNAYYKDKIVDWNKIRIPTYVTAGWVHHHLRGAFEGFRRIRTPKKWMRAHRDFEWPDSYKPENLDDIRRFFDRYCKEIHNVECRGYDNMDLFPWVIKLDKDGNYVPIRVMGAPFRGAWGFLRCSHRDLDPKYASDFQPVHSHEKEERMQPGEIVPVDVEMYPHSRFWHKGEKLQVVIAGRFIKTEWFHDNDMNHATDNGDGIHVIHTGGEHQSYLQIPVVPPKYQVGDYIWHGDENK